ncbi:hypothetical protein [Halanaerobacter jeridensis]|uniref:Uncharacterized protein n=1 Tax=Halanaerobacter jeridensis TaxID=706427 RepID=A0A938XR27_9FIRM|nr:hypothetical protein [Halanaerobacter jeridensis]MBM7555813.1 hypothetical protein [Halanaerobacter jeridensis]
MQLTVSSFFIIGGIKLNLDSESGKNLVDLGYQDDIEYIVKEFEEIIRSHENGIIR